MILAETVRADRAPLQNHANAREDTRRQVAQNIVIVPGHGEYLNSKTDILNEIGRIEGIIQEAIKNGKAPTV